jgi:hypothetical protein
MVSNGLRAIRHLLGMLDKFYLLTPVESQLTSMRFSRERRNLEDFILIKQRFGIKCVERRRISLTFLYVLV